ncbi:MAG: fimbrillin family protein [Bacteroidaceae bacterium]|nr:fimbrillin family protein [Bacteroidaceae bacterium]
MNRVYYIYNKVAMMLISALLMVSCALDNPVEKQEIMTFQPVVNKARASKAITQSTEYPTTESFCISAFYYIDEAATTPPTNYIVENVVSYDGTVWNTSTDYYWPLSGYMDFKAYSPAGLKEQGADISYSQGVSISNYTIDSFEDTQVDFMYSEPLDKKINNAEHLPTVGITFKHALTQVAFTVKPQKYFNTTADGITNHVTITIDKLSLRNMYYRGSFSQNPNPQWDVYDESDTYTVPYLIDYTLLNKDPGQGTKLKYDGTTPMSVPVMLDQNTELAALLIPQTLNKDAALVVTYSVTQTTKRGDEVIVAPYTITFSNSIQILGNPKQVLEMGKKLVYNIRIGLDAISLEATNGDWSGSEEIVEPQ